MGLPMATNLAQKWKVLAFDTNKEALKIAQEAGCQTATDLNQLGDCSIIFTMLPGCNAVDHVTPILLDSASSSTVFVDSSTVSIC